MSQYLAFLSLFQLLQELNHAVKFERVGIHVENVALLVNKLVGWVLVDAHEVLDGILLGIGQVVVNDVVAQKVVLFYDILPCIFRTSVCQVEIDDVNVLQRLAHLSSV